jgi:hypothetical protein
MWGKALTGPALESLKTFSEEFGSSVSAGDLLLLGRGWYVTHSGLIRLARRNRCHGITVRPDREFSTPNQSRWAFEATVCKSRTCRDFVGYGDADPSNVSYLVQGAEMRVAETRAVNRALRKAYGIGICSVEEMGRSPNLRFRPQSQRSYLHNPPTGAAAAPFAIGSAKSFARISSIPSWSSLMQSISAE